MAMTECIAVWDESSASVFGFMMSAGCSNMLSERRICFLFLKNGLDCRREWPFIGEPFRWPPIPVMLPNCGLLRTFKGIGAQGLLAD